MNISGIKATPLDMHANHPILCAHPDVKSTVHVSCAPPNDIRTANNLRQLEAPRINFMTTSPIFNDSAAPPENNHDPTPEPMVRQIHYKGTKNEKHIE